MGCFCCVPALPEGNGLSKLYQIVYADPPWRYEHCKTNNRKIENHYQTMNLEDIKSLKVPADPKGCVLYLWATAPKCEEALSVMNAWGFSYRSQAIWDKKRIGMGYWFRIQHEILLVGVKGKMSPPAASQRVSSIFEIVRGKHSEKPDVFRKKIEEWYPEANKLEMFARTAPEGWDVFGNEVEDSIEIVAA